jgi:hypothetical protein
MQRYDYQKSGRTITDISLNFEGDTFFRIGNYRDPKLYEMTVYSWEKEEIWQPRWRRFVSMLSSQFGPSRVTTQGPTPAPDKTRDRNTK